jgi:lambda family phage minor tail protein L
MSVVPPEIIAAGQALDPSGAFVYLIDVPLNDSETLRLTSNNESITFDGNAYQPIALAVSGVEINGDGNASQLSVEIDNAVGTIGTAMQRNAGLTDVDVVVRYGNTADVANTAAWLRESFTVTESGKNSRAATLRLATSPVYESPVPKQQFLRTTCSNTYRNARCGYTNQTASVAGATNASPIVITTSTPNRFASGSVAVVSGVGGNTAANGTWTILVLTATTFALVGSAGNGSYTSGGSVVVSLPTCDLTMYGPNGCVAHDNWLNYRAAVSVPRAG